MSKLKEAEAFKDMLMEASSPFIHPHIEGVFSVFELEHKQGSPSCLTPKQQCADEMYEMLDNLCLYLFELDSLGTTHKARQIDKLLAKARGEL